MCLHTELNPNAVTHSVVRLTSKTAQVKGGPNPLTATITVCDHY